MQFIADFHIHSQYSRATSKEMNVETLNRWAAIKGINLLGTGDFTHPNYFAQLRLRLTDDGNGLYKLKKSDSPTRFILTAEISNMFSQGGKGRRIHTLIMAPDLAVVEKINKALKKIGNIASDGRPIFGRPVKDMVKLVLDISPDCFIVPAHAWTPWFSVFGANSGFDSIEECFEDQAKNIYCIETGLSSDPQMNWRLSALDKITLISNSDAHSPRRIGREANVFDCAMSYKEIIDTLKTKDAKRFLYTVEFFPEEGKYHYDGHRACNIIQSPEQSKLTNNICPVCKKTLTVGVCNRVDKLADRPDGFKPPNAIPFRHLVPLDEIIGEAMGQGAATAGVEEQYNKLIARGKNELNILLNLSLDDIALFTSERIVEAIRRVREGRLNIVPGHDGVYGKIAIFSDSENPSTVYRSRGSEEDETAGAGASASAKEQAPAVQETPEEEYTFGLPKPPPVNQMRLF